MHRSEIADEVARLDKQQREFLQNASVLGVCRADSEYAERLLRIAQLLTELVTLEETTRCEPTEIARKNQPPERGASSRSFPDGRERSRH